MKYLLLMFLSLNARATIIDSVMSDVRAPIQPTQPLMPIQPVYQPTQQTICHAETICNYGGCQTTTVCN